MRRFLLLMLALTTAACTTTSGPHLSPAPVQRSVATSSSSLHSSASRSASPSASPSVLPTAGSACHLTPPGTDAKHPVTFNGAPLFSFAAPFHQGYAYEKTVWSAARGAPGPAAIHGYAADGSGEQVAFTKDLNGTPQAELALDARLFADPALTEAAYALIRHPGCYLFEVSGPGYDYTFTFRADAANPVPTTADQNGCGATPIRFDDVHPAWSQNADPPAGVPWVLSEKGDAIGVLFSYPLKSGQNVSDKILWIVRLPRGVAPMKATADLLGTTTSVVLDPFPADAGPGEIYPSGDEMPKPGCWHFTLSWAGNQDSVYLPYS